MDDPLSVALEERVCNRQSSLYETSHEDMCIVNIVQTYNYTLNKIWTLSTVPQFCRADDADVYENQLPHLSTFYCQTWV